jgi:CDP-glucose 4,6-dehydratase
MLTKGVTGEWNFGPEIDTNTKVSKVADMAARTWGQGASWALDGDPQLHEAGYLLLDSSKARRELDWQDKLNFGATMSWTIDFYKSAVNGKSPRVLLQEQVDAYSRL